MFSKQLLYLIILDCAPVANQLCPCLLIPTKVFCFVTRFILSSISRGPSQVASFFKSKHFSIHPKSIFDFVLHYLSRSRGRALQSVCDCCLFSNYWQIRELWIGFACWFQEIVIIDWPDPAAINFISPNKQFFALGLYFGILERTGQCQFHPHRWRCTSQIDCYQHYSSS